MVATEKSRGFSAEKSRNLLRLHTVFLGCGYFGFDDADAYSMNQRAIEACWRVRLCEVIRAPQELERLSDVKWNAATVT